jgi:hypothetical protein
METSAFDPLAVSMILAVAMLLMVVAGQAKGRLDWRRGRWFRRRRRQ